MIQSSSYLVELISTKWMTDKLVKNIMLSVRISFIILRAILNEDINRYLDDQGHLRLSRSDKDKNQGRDYCIQFGDEFSLWT